MRLRSLRRPRFRPRRPVRPILQIVLALALPGLALLICELTEPLLSDAATLPFLAAVVLASWFGGFHCGLGAMIASAVTLVYFFIPPRDTFRIQSASGYAELFAFLATSILLASLIRSLYRAQAETIDTESRSRNVTDLIPFGAWRADSEGNMIELSDSFLSAFGTSMTRCAGMGWIELIVPNEREAIAADWKRCVKECDFWDCEYHAQAKDGTVYTVLSRAVPFRTNRGFRSWIGLHLDVTEREKATERRLEHERDIARFNAELDQFAYVASHDLQEPLRMIASYLQLVSKRYRDRLDEDGRTFIDYSVEGANRLQALLQGLHLLSVIGKSPDRREPTPLAEVVEKAKSNLQVKIAKTNSVVDVEELPVVNCDRFEVTQLFELLLDNSLKFREPDSSAKVVISAKREHGFWHIILRDYGIGVDTEYHHRMFDLFQRLHSREAYPGTGIGLTICKKIVEVHGGRIWAENADGGGVAIHFTLPA